MGRAGEYETRLRWLQCDKITSDTGDREDVFTPHGHLWCVVEETNSRRQSEYNAAQSGADVEIRVRNYPTVTVQDRLQDEHAGYVYRIDGIRNGDDEIIIDAYRIRLEDTDVDESGGG